MSNVMLVTGGSRGIGAAVCRLAARRGYDVAVNYAGNETAAATVVRDIEAAGRRAVAVQADVTRRDDVARLFDETEATLGPVHTLVNNAGITGRIGRLDEIEPEVIARTVDINVLGTIWPSREAVLRLSTKRGGAGGVIVNLSSVAASLGSPDTYVWYAATKGAVDSFTHGLGKEVIGDGIRVVGVAPGMTETEIHAAGGIPDRASRLGSETPIGRAAKPEEIAEAILWVASDAAGYMVGETIRVGGGR